MMEKFDRIFLTELVQIYRGSLFSFCAFTDFFYCVIFAYLIFCHISNTCRVSRKSFNFYSSRCVSVKFIKMNLNS